jgi:hypothetical protein
MSKWVFIVGGILLTIIIVAVVAVLNINSYIQRNREYLIQQAEKAVGRQIEVQNIEVNLWNGIGIRFENFSLADDPAFSSSPSYRPKVSRLTSGFCPCCARMFRSKDSFSTILG